MGRAMEMKTPAEMRDEERIAKLKASVDALQATRDAIVAMSPDRDFYPDNSPKRKARVTHKHTRIARMGTTSMVGLWADLPSTLVEWVCAIAKPGERVVLTVLR